MTVEVALLGFGGFGREVLDVVAGLNRSPSTGSGTGQPGGTMHIVGVLDDGTPNATHLADYDVEHLGPLVRLATLPDSVGYLIGIGDPTARRRVDEYGQRLGRSSPVAVHPSATVARNVEMGPGTIVCSHVSITNHIQLGRHVHVNLNCTIGHDAVLEDYVTLSPLVAVSGNVTIHAGAFIGTGATLNPGITIGAGAVVGSGAAVLKDVGPGATVVGVPAKPRG